MGTEQMPVQVTPLWSNSRAQNVQLVQKQLIEAGKLAEAHKFLIEYAEALKKYRRGLLDHHPVTAAAQAVGADVHWGK